MPISVAGITTMDEPIADILGRFEDAVIKRSAAGDSRVSLAQSAFSQSAFSQIACAKNVEEYVRACPNISWIGLAHLAQSNDAL